jgi:hypothetical protein
MVAGKNRARDQAIFTEHALGDSPQEIGERHGLSVARVYQVIAAQRALTPARTQDELRQDLMVQLNALRREAHRIAMSDPLPVYAPKTSLLTGLGDEDDGSVLTPVIGADYSGQLGAMKVTVAIANRIAKMHGLDSERVETAGTVRYELVGVDPDDI